MTNQYGSTGSHIGAESAEDAMEISSEFGQKTVTEEDIDIDLDLGEDQNGDGEDEYMIEYENTLQDEDTLDLQGQETRKDDEMVDEALSPGMEDEPLANDENLIDAEEEPLSDVNATAGNEIDEADQYNSPGPYHLHQGISDETADSLRRDDARIPTPTVFSNSTNIQEIANVTGSDTIDDGLQLLISVDDVKERHDDNIDEARDTKSNREIVSEDSKEDSKDHSKDLGASKESDIPAGTNKQPPKGTLPTNSIVDNSTHPKEAAGIQLASNEGYTVTHPYTDESLQGDSDVYQYKPLHSVKVLYEENEISLFPPGEEDSDQTQTYLLQDHTLVDGNIQDLLAACRLVLGESIEVHDELHIDIEVLDLRFSESTPESSTMSLRQMIELYLHLQHNDEIDDPSPLCITLIAKCKLANRLNYLYAAVAEGKGLSEISNPTQYSDLFNESHDDLDQDYGQDVSSFEPNDHGSRVREDEHDRGTPTAETGSGESHDDTTQTNQVLLSPGKSADATLPALADRADKREDLQAKPHKQLSDDIEWYNDNLEDNLQVHGIMQSGLDGVSGDPGLNADSRLGITDAEHNSLEEALIQKNIPIQDTDTEKVELIDINDSPQALTESNTSTKLNGHVTQPLDSQSHVNYDEKIDDRATEGNLESSAASSTVRGDGSEALVDTELTFVDGKVQDEFHDDPLASVGYEELTNIDSSTNQFTGNGNDKDNYSEVDYDDYEEDGEVEALLQCNGPEETDPGKEQFVIEDVKNLSQEDFTAPDVGNGSLFDDDEITYDDDDEDDGDLFANKSPNHGQDIHVIISTSSSTPLKRVRTSSEEVKNQENTAQTGIKKIRSQ